MTRHADDTTRGIVVPLATTAIVCLLLTSGVVFLSGSDSDPDDRTGRGDHAALDLHMATAAPPTETGSSPGPIRPSPTGSSQAESGTPTAGVASEGPAVAPTKPIRPAATTRATAPETTASLPAPPTADHPSQPRPPGPPSTTASTTGPTTEPVPQGDARPGDISVDSSYTPSNRGATGRVVITNTTSRTLPSWDLTLTASGRRSGFTMLYGSGASASIDGGTALARGSGPLLPGASVVLAFGLYGDVRSMGCTFTGVACRVRGDRDDD